MLNKWSSDSALCSIEATCFSRMYFWRDNLGCWEIREVKTIEKTEPLSLLHTSSESSEPKPKLSAGTVSNVCRIETFICVRKTTTYAEPLWGNSQSKVFLSHSLQLLYDPKKHSIGQLKKITYWNEYALIHINQYLLRNTLKWRQLLFFNYCKLWKH